MLVFITILTYIFGQHSCVLIPHIICVSVTY